MWSNSDGDQLKNIFAKLNKIMRFAFLVFFDFPDFSLNWRYRHMEGRKMVEKYETLQTFKSSQNGLAYSGKS